MPRMPRSTMAPQPQPSQAHGEEDFFSRPVTGSTMSHPFGDRDAQKLPQGLEPSPEDQRHGEPGRAELGVLLLEDRMLGVQGVEALGQPEGLAGDQRKLQ